jgi:uncharacterized protein YkwD
MIVFVIGCTSFLGLDVAPEATMEVPYKGYSDVETLLRATAQDNHDTPDILHIEWESDIDGMLSFSPINSNGMFQFNGLLSTGIHLLSLYVEDQDGNFVEVEQNFVVDEQNSVPTCSIEQSSEEFWSAQSPITLTGQANDLNLPPSDLIVEWSSNFDGSLGSGTIEDSGVLNLGLPELSWNEHTITLTVTDEVGSVCTQETIVRVGHIPNNNYCAPIADWSDEWKSFEEEVLTLTNEIRSNGTSCGGQAYPPVPPLMMQRNLRCSARVHSKDMYERDFFDHTNPSGEGPADRIEQANYAWMSYGENIAWRYSTPEEVVQGWNDSPGHCTNMMSDWFDEIGVGMYDAGTGIYWTQNFGSR